MCASNDWLTKITSFPYGPSQETPPRVEARYPFSFTYGSRSSDEALGDMGRYDRTEQLDANRTALTVMWTDCDTKLRITWKAIRYSDFPAVEWVLWFENTGSAETPIISNLQALDIALSEPISAEVPYKLHKTKGGAAGPQDFEPSVVTIDDAHPDRMGGDIGRSSNKDFPFFKIETGKRSLVTAVGWSGMWQSDTKCSGSRDLRLTAGLQRTNFKLLPGEKVRSPRILMLDWAGDTQEANAQFRQLIYKHYTAKRDGVTPLPSLFSNTCFTAHELGDNATAANQIALINGYGPLGLDAVVTDAGWMEGSQGGWWRGVGTWTPRTDNYPNGMAPVAAAAKANNHVYGLWFEIETAMEGTWLWNNKPELLLDVDAHSLEGRKAKLLNFAKPETVDYVFGVVKGLMQLPGFRMYRQDFGLISPDPFWAANDTPDRVGITEMKYIMGMYDFWDRIAREFPDSIREECSAGGRRMDLETVMRMQLHQKTDYWFDNEVDQGSIWGLSQYIPNNCFAAQLNRYDDYSFHSTLASSLCVGWTSDSPDYDSARAKALTDRYKQVRHLLVGAWYPLLPYSRDLTDWMATQYHRPDLNEGMILALRHAESSYSAARLALKGLIPDADYELTSDLTGTKITRKGSELMAGFDVSIPQRHQSDLIVYKRIP